LRTSCSTANPMVRRVNSTASIDATSASNAKPPSADRVGKSTTKPAKKDARGSRRDARTSWWTPAMMTHAQMISPFASTVYPAWDAVMCIPHPDYHSPPLPYTAVPVHPVAGDFPMIMGDFVPSNADALPLTFQPPHCLLDPFKNFPGPLTPYHPWTPPPPPVTALLTGPANPFIPLLRPCSKPLFKTKMCTAWLRTKTCKNMDTCRFAHGFGELRPHPFWGRRLPVFQDITDSCV